MHRNRLLIIDDQPDIAALVAKIALTCDYEVAATSTGEEFLRQYHEWHPTHIALDLQMPGLDGVELIRGLAAEHSQAKVLIMSGFDINVLESARRLGTERGLAMVGTITKPIRVADLQKSLNSVKLQEIADENALREALENRQIHLDYQPKIKLADCSAGSFEALARWRHPTLGMIPPMEFVTLAERSGLANALTDEVARIAFAQLRAWHQQGFDMHVAINLSGRNLSGVEFADRLFGLCRQFEVKPEWVTLELTETATAESAIDAMDILTRLRLRGFQLSIDDFGTGYSSLKQLQRLPFSELKVDREFVSGCAKFERDGVIVKTIIGLAHNLGLSVVAEGAEDHEVVDLLLGWGCDLVQGYAFSRPLAADSTLEWVHRWHATQAAAAAAAMALQPSNTDEREVEETTDIELAAVAGTAN